MNATARFAANFSGSASQRNRAGRALTPSASLCADGSGAPSHRLRSRLSLLALSLLAAALALPATAPAAPHDYLYSFGPDGTSATSFVPGNVAPILALQGSTRRLYLRSSNDNRVYGFDVSAAAPPLSLLSGFDPLPYTGKNPGGDNAPALAVDESGGAGEGNVYLNVDPSVLSVSGDNFNSALRGYGPAGAPLAATPFPLTQFSAGAVAVDSRGRIWVGNGSIGSAAVRVYSPAGALLEERDLGMSSKGLAFDANDDLYATNGTSVREFSAASDHLESTTVVAASGIRAIAVDRRSHHLFVAVYDNVANTAKVLEFDSAGNPLGEFATGVAGANYTGLAVDPQGHRVYVADKGTQSSEQQRVTIAGATGGAYALCFEGECTAATGTGDTAVGSAEGTGILTAGSTTITDVNTTSGAFAVGQNISTFGTLTPGQLAQGTRIVAVGAGTLTVSPPAETSGFAGHLGASSFLVTNLNVSTGNFTPGETITGPGIPAGTTIVSVNAAEHVLRLSAATTAAGTGVALSAALAHDAPSSDVQSALRGLPPIEAGSGLGGGSVSVEGSGSSSPIVRTVTFTGAFAGIDVPLLTSDASALTPAPPTSTIDVQTTVAATVTDPDQVRVYEAADPVPSLSLQDPDPLANTTATLKGSVDPEGSALSQCRFQWVTQDAFRQSGFDDLSSGGQADCDPGFASIPTGGATDVSAGASGLTPHTTYVYRIFAANGVGENAFADSFSTPAPPTAQTTGASLPTPTSALLGGRVNPLGEPTSYHFQYTSEADFQANGFAGAKATSAVDLAADEVQQFFPGADSPPYKISFGGAITSTLSKSASAAELQAALEALPTIGAGNVEVSGPGGVAGFVVAFTGALGSQDVPLLYSSKSTASVSAAIPGGFGDRISLVDQRVSDLDPDTAYRYRLIADNGNADGATVGNTMSLTTNSAQPLTNPDFPHPPGNDRAWEMVSIADSGGNPATWFSGISEDGDSVIYKTAGGTPVSDQGTLVSPLLAKRPPGEHPSGGWESASLAPRSLYYPGGPDWVFWPNPDASAAIGVNANVFGGLHTPGDVDSIWRIGGLAGPYELLSRQPYTKDAGYFFEASDSLARVVTAIADSLDPANPADPTAFHLYDVSDPGTAPQLLDLAPDGGGVCGVNAISDANEASKTQFMINDPDFGKRRLLSADGQLMIYPSAGGDSSCPVDQLILRDIPAATAKPISLLAGGATEAGPACGAIFIRATDEAAFFNTKTDLDPADSAPGSCADAGKGDVYRYQFDDGSLKCLTCLPGLPEAGVNRGGVSRDGSAVYFATDQRMLAGAASPGTYRLDVRCVLGGPCDPDGPLAYVAPAAVSVSDALGSASAVSTDGSSLAFVSDSLALTPQGGPQNGGTKQFYLYDHDDRSLTCVSCPPDGSPPRAGVTGITSVFADGGTAISVPLTFNADPLSDDGSTFAFDAPSSLVSADQNTAPSGADPIGGRDVYEWRNGRALLISDGLTNWRSHEISPQQDGVSDDGRNVFFSEPAQLTPDAIDNYTRIYDARLGGGIAFPEEPQPCPLEVCQGTPKGAPDDPTPASRSFTGAGNVKPSTARCRKGKVRRKGRCVAKKHKPRKRHRRANHNRRAHR